MGAVATAVLTIQAFSAEMDDLKRVTGNYCPADLAIYNLPTPTAYCGRDNCRAETQCTQKRLACLNELLEVQHQIMDYNSWIYSCRAEAARKEQEVQRAARNVKPARIPNPFVEEPDIAEIAKEAKRNAQGANRANSQAMDELNGFEARERQKFRDELIEKKRRQLAMEAARIEQFRRRLERQRADDETVAAFNSMMAGFTSALGARSAPLPPPVSSYQPPPPSRPAPSGGGSIQCPNGSVCATR